MNDHPILFSAPMIRALLDGRKTQTRRIVKPLSKRHPILNLKEHGRDDGGCSGRFNDPSSWGFPYAEDGEDMALSDWVSCLCPYGKPGDLLWVRETTTYWERPDSKESITPKANESNRPANGVRYQRWMERTMPKDDEMLGEDFIVYKADDSKVSIGAWKHPHPIYDHCVGRFGKTVTAIHMPRWASRLTLRITDVRVERLQEISIENAIAEGVGIRCDSAMAIMEYSLLWESIHGPRSWDQNPWVWAISFDVIKANVDRVLAQRTAT